MNHAATACIRPHSRKPVVVRRPPGLTSTSRTLFAIGAAMMGQLASRWVGPARRTLCVGAPPRTTGGGVRTKQLLSLTTARNELPCGWLDLVNARCVVSEYRCLISAQSRRGESLEFTFDDYTAFIEWLAAALAPLQVRLFVGR
jgi:hypothetical protein